MSKPMQRHEALGEFFEGLGEAMMQLGYRFKQMDGFPSRGNEPVTPVMKWTPEAEAADYKGKVYASSSTEDLAAEPEEPKKKQKQAADYDEVFATMEGIFSVKEVADKIPWELSSMSSVDYQCKKNPKVVPLSAAEAQEELARRGGKIVAGKKPKFYRYDPTVGVRKKRVTLSDNDFRNLLISMDGKPFTIQQLADKGEISYVSAMTKVKDRKDCIKLTESDRSAGVAATYRFDHTVGQPQMPHVPKPKVQDLKEKRKLHALRQNGARKPNGGSSQMMELVDNAWDQGWLVIKTGSGHFKFLSPDEKNAVVIAQTPSDFRAYKNARSDLKRAGLEL